MANVKVTLDYQINDGMSLTFKAPCDCTAVTGLIVYYPNITENATTQTSKVFTFKDAHGNDLTNIGNLFTNGVYIKVILDTTNSYAYIQNADTNGYLEGRFTRLVNNGTVMSQNANYAEVGEWVDGNTNDENRIGYFVSIDERTAGTTMVKATSTSDVRGVTVATPAFSGNCSPDKFDEDGNLLKQYDFVAVMGLVSVIDNGTCTINSRCMPSDDGTAVPSNNNMGYRVIDRIDSTHILIGVEPSADMLNRIKTQMAEMQAEIKDGVVSSIKQNGVVLEKAEDGTVNILTPILDTSDNGTVTIENLEDTSELINRLLDEKLGAIENGTY